MTYAPSTYNFQWNFAPSVPYGGAAGMADGTATRETFANFVATWRDEMLPQWSRLHLAGVDDILNVHLLPAFGTKPLLLISRADVMAFRSSIAKLPGLGGKRLSAVRINKIMTILGQIMAEAAIRYGFPSPCKSIKRLKTVRPEIQPFSLSEIDLICSRVHPDLRAYVTTRFYSGMRTGEINALKWHNVDFEHRRIRVRETYSAGMDEPRTKTELSLRDIPMLPPVVEALRSMHRHPDSPYVFHSRRGNPIDAHNFANRIWYPLLKELGLARRRPYQTRHTTATLLLAAGENPEWIARFLGHASTAMLFTVYSRYVPNLTRQDGAAVAGLLNARCTSSTHGLSRQENQE